jgi:hypothetical protein
MTDPIAVLNCSACLPHNVSRTEDFESSTTTSSRFCACTQQIYKDMITALFGTTHRFIGLCGDFGQISDFVEDDNNICVRQVNRQHIEKKNREIYRILLHFGDPVRPRD